MRGTYPPAPVDTILSRLGGVVKQSKGGWAAHCPVCGADSLTVADKKDGTVYLYCPNGCTAKAIAEKVGLTVWDLIAEFARGPKGSNGNGHAADVAGAPTPAPPATDEEPVDESWRDRLVWSYRKDGTRKVKNKSVNVATILANDPAVAGRIGYDAFLEDVVSLDAPPWNAPPLVNDLGATALRRGWGDDDYTRLTCWLESAWDVGASRDTLYGIVLMLAKKHQAHPIREYLYGLWWDGTPRLATWLATYLGANDPPDYLASVGAKWLISAVARIFQPGCKADHVLILEGGQGIGKSSALRILAGDWTSDTPIHIGTKDAYLSLRGSWIVELAELDSMIRAENSEAKAFFTSAVDRFRPPYARAAVDFPRQCVFAGSVNQSDYLRDETGARRYWPVACASVDLVGLKRDRDQLWAEAVARHRRGETWWPTVDEQKEAGKQQAARQIEDPWLPLIAEFLAMRTEQQWTTVGLLNEAVDVPKERVDRKMQMRLGQIMCQMPGWKSDRIFIAGQQLRGYKKTV